MFTYLCTAGLQPRDHQGNQKTGPTAGAAGRSGGP